MTGCDTARDISQLTAPDQVKQFIGGGNLREDRQIKPRLVAFSEKSLQLPLGIKIVGCRTARSLSETIDEDQKQT